MTIACLLGLAMGPYMHESDQALLFDGAVRIATGQLHDARGGYNFDKQFVSYFLLGGVFKLLPRPFSPDQVVLAGNLVSFALFWGALFWLLARSRQRLAAALILPVTLAPVLLEHSPFFATAFVSGGFLLLLLGLLTIEPANARPRFLRSLVVFFLTFCAVGARADAILLLPLFVMLHSRHRSIAGIIQWGKAWIVILAAGTSIVFGRVFYSGAFTDFLPRFFKPKVFAAFALFGLGGAILLLVVCLAAVVSVWRIKRSRLWAMLLAVALLLPLFYYAAQLTTPRYFVPVVVGLFAFVYSKRGRAILRLWFRARAGSRLLEGALLVTAILPLLVGLRLADVRHPQLVFVRPAQFPSADGVLPMGAYCDYLLGIRRQNGLVDHNEAVWKAAKATTFETNSQGAVPVLLTPMSSYLFLAVRLQNKPARLCEFQAEKKPPSFYVDSRSLMRAGFTWQVSAESVRAFFLGASLQPASSANREGITILRDSHTPIMESRSPLFWVLNEVFAGDDFRIKEEMPVSTNNTLIVWQVAANLAGKKLAVISQRPFQCTVTLPGGSKDLETRGIADPTMGRWHVCVVEKAFSGMTLSLRSELPNNFCMASSFFPAWMSVRKF